MGSEWERQTPMEWKNSHQMGKISIAACGKVGKQPPNEQNNYCSMRKKLLPQAHSGKTAPKWAKYRLLHAEKWENSPQMSKITIAVCAKNYCRRRKSGKNYCSMRKKLLPHAQKWKNSPKWAK
jgi:hypothetical protein